jgi:phage shock protein PspC (stress-responsive transcriptional regulator)
MYTMDTTNVSNDETSTNWTVVEEEHTEAPSEQNPEAQASNGSATDSETVEKNEIMTNNASKRMLYRSSSDKLLGGVCGGIAEFTGWNASIVRILWIALTLMTGGGGFLAYVALWILLPVGSVENGVERAAALPLSEKNLTRIAFLLIGLGALWLLTNIGVVPWLWNLFGGAFRVLFWPALLIASGYLVLRYLGKDVKWNSKETTERVKSEVGERMPSGEEVKSGFAKMRQNFPLKRSGTDKMFMGVCGGIGQKLGIDSNLVRLVWAAFSIGSIGMGVLIYVLIGLFLPEEPETDLVARDDEAQNVTIVDATAG